MTLRHRARRAFRPGAYLRDRFAFARLRAASEAHLAAGRPQLAVYAFDYIGAEIALRGAFERDELELLFRFLAPLEAAFSRTTALDIGANIGNHAVWFADRFAAVHAYEPNPQAFRLLEINAGLRPNIEPRQAGIGAAPGNRTLVYEGGNLGAASAAGAAEAQDRHRREITIESLDRLYGADDRIGLVKIDVEGMEDEVLAGAAGLLARDRPVVVLEQRPGDFSGAETPAIARLRALGYRIFLIERRHWGGNALFRIANLLRQTLLGVEETVTETDPVRPGFHPMILALTPDRIGALDRTGS